MYICKHVHAHVSYTMYKNVHVHVCIYIYILNLSYTAWPSSVAIVRYKNAEPTYTQASRLCILAIATDLVIETFGICCLL